ncbi:MAG: hypothetical protein B9S32_09450 [Verrucomicrobia bacterium Tous-C9LFEB]|nr:MAG: hypothetical protein B9S32_09450 [Verrucomicrobia bacterium Tous-C9LFEB]
MRILTNNAKRQTRSGMALILVMCLLVLLSCLFMGYFSSITAERISAKNFAVTNETRLLAESAVNIVMSQIVEATTREPDSAWTSQPGMIRTFDADGNPLHCYKLYSSNKMVVKGGFNARALVSQEIPEDWSDRKGEFIDLNAPSKRLTGWRYPVVDPTAAKQVEGFAPDPKFDVAMPVRWIYVLRSGQLVVGVPQGRGRLKIAAATTENPVVGRIAFWTDDETCKVNINTASEGVFWETPRTQSLADQTMAIRQPRKGEFSRFAGHPATVCLSTVLPSLVGNGAPRYGKIYAMTPRIGATGGSQEGTIEIANQSDIADKQDRLYGSLDELLYSMSRQTNSGLVSSEIERGRFFLTVASRSPELNLFNRPRVTLWPVPFSESKRSALDRLMVLCSTIPGAGNARLYFTRQDNRSATVDYTGDAKNRKLYEYLQQLTSQPVPGFGGGSLASKYGGTAGRDQLLTEIFDFVRCANLFDPNLPKSSDLYTAKTPGQVVPIAIGNTHGLGRYPTLAEAAIQFYATSTDSGTGMVNGMRAALLLALSNPAQGYAATTPSYTIRVATKTPFSTDTTPTFSFTGDIDRSKMSTSTESSLLGGEESFARLISASYPYVLKADIPVTGGKFNFGGGVIEVSFLPNATASQSVQTVQVKFPKITTTLAAPLMPPATGSYAGWSDYSKRREHVSDPNYFQFDVVRSVTPLGGDCRLTAGMSTVLTPEEGGPACLAPLSETDYLDATKARVFSLRTPGGEYYTDAKGPALSEGDWDNGVGNTPDGAYIGKPDEGSVTSNSSGLPYFNGDTTAVNEKFYFNQRQIASPVALGSLPTGVVLGTPWQTLLFNPHPTANAHPGGNAPPDFLWLDLFCVPTVEPYALSSPLTASGRVNLNYEMVPFTGMVRTTALRAALKSTRILAIPTGETTYKKGSPVASSYYHAISAEETLKGFDQRFSDGDVYRAAAEVCNLELVPDGVTFGGVKVWWQGQTLTGDNSREMPYNHLYPLLTTQSNAYQVHCRAQSLIKGSGSDPQIWEEGRDVVSGEYRVSSVIERWIDPNDSRLQTVDVFDKSLTPYYRFRVVSTAPFVP